MKKLSHLLASVIMLFTFIVMAFPAYALTSDSEPVDDGTLTLRTYDCETGVTTISRYNDTYVGDKNAARYTSYSNDITLPKDISIKRLTNPEYNIMGIHLDPDPDLSDWPSVNTNFAPYCRIVYIEIAYDVDRDGIVQLDEWYGATGFMVGPDVLLTAAHCTFIPGYGLVREFKVYLKYDYGDVKTPYYANKFTWSTEWTNSSNPSSNYDWCIVTMNNNIQAITGAFNISSSTSINGSNVTLSGYTDYFSPDQPTQRACGGTITSVGSYRLSYSQEPADGQSGSPIYNTSSLYAYGIHTNSASFFSDASGVRFYSTLFSYINENIQAGRTKYGY